MPVRVCGQVITDGQTNRVSSYTSPAPDKRRSTHLPQLLQLVDLLCGDLASPELLLLRGNFDEPRQELAVLDERLPLARVPATVDIQMTLLTI